MNGGPGARWYPWLTAVLMAEVIALTFLQAPNELFFRFAFSDSGTSFTIQDLIRRGYRPTIDFGYIYGLLPLLIHRVWFSIFGANPGAFWGANLVCNLAMAWGLARFASAQRVGWAGTALLVAAMPDLLRTSYDVLVQALEPALLVHALAEQARGRRDRALALATTSAFVKPSMAYVYGLVLLFALAVDRTDRASWRRALGPALVTGAVLAVVLAAVYGAWPLVRTLIPTGGMNVYRESHFGFFRGSGRAFWYRPDAGLRGYLRYEIGYWLAGTFVLIVGGLESLLRWARKGKAAPTIAHNDEIALTCALLHITFVTLFFGHSFSWKYYLAIFLLGLAALAARGRRHAWIIGGLAAMVLFTDKAWVQALADDWKARAPSATTRGLWATPGERREWAHVLALTRGRRPALLADCEGATLLYPQFAPPMGAYFVPGHPLPAEVRRKATQLAAASMIVKVGHPGDHRFNRWPALVSALDGCEVLWQGSHYQIYRRR